MLRLCYIIALVLSLLGGAGGVYTPVLTGANTVDYSCLHAGSWLVNNGEFNKLFGANPGIMASNKTTLTSKTLFSTASTSNYWQILTNLIPIGYGHTFKGDEIFELNRRANKLTDFASGSATTAVAGSIYDFGADIGFSKMNCVRGWWPPGTAADCPIARPKLVSFPLMPMPENTVVANAKSSTLAGVPGCYVGQGAIGMWVSGATMVGFGDGLGFNFHDSYSYAPTGYDNNLSLNMSTWHNLAPYFEKHDMDVCLGHASAAGGIADYHHHTYSPCLAAVLGDTGAQHSPIYGWALDGYPVYGPWQDNNLLAKSCWSTRSYGTSRADGLGGCGPNPAGSGGSTQERTCLLKNIYDLSAGIVDITDSKHYGPTTIDDVVTKSFDKFRAVSGVFLEDYFYSGASCTTQGVEYLDSYNGHDHDGLGWHYHITLETDMSPKFPFVVGPKFKGCIPNGTCNTLPFGATSWLEAGPTNGWAGGVTAASTTVKSTCNATNIAFSDSMSPGVSKATSIKCSATNTFSPTFQPTAPSPKPTIKGLPTPPPTFPPSPPPTVAPSPLTLSWALLRISLSGISDLAADQNSRRGLIDGPGTLLVDRLFTPSSTLRGLAGGSSVSMAASDFRAALASFLGLSLGMIGDPVVSGATKLRRELSVVRGLDRQLHPNSNPQSQTRVLTSALQVSVLISGTTATVSSDSLTSAMANTTDLATKLSATAGVAVSVQFLGADNVSPTRTPTMAPTNPISNPLTYFTIVALGGFAFITLSLVTVLCFFHQLWRCCVKVRGSFAKKAIATTDLLTKSEKVDVIPDTKADFSIGDMRAVMQGHGDDSEVQDHHTKEDAGHTEEEEKHSGELEETIHEQSQAPAVPPSPASLAAAERYRREVKETLKRANPTLLPDLPAIFDEWRGREAALLASVRIKYPEHRQESSYDLGLGSVWEGMTGGVEAVGNALFAPLSTGSAASESEIVQLEGERDPKPEARRSLTPPRRHYI